MYTASSPLEVSNVPLWDPTGLVTGRSGAILNDDIFSDGDCGWCPLWTLGDANQYGTVSWICRSGTPRLAIRADIQTNGYMMGIKRMGQVAGVGAYLVEFVASFEFLNGDLQYPRYYSFGIDTASPSGARRLFEFRFLNYDESQGAAGNKWQLNTSMSQVWADVPNAAYTLTNNENKALPYYIAFMVDTASGTYEGFRVNKDIMVGSLAPTADASLHSIGPMISSSLPSFAGGLNPCSTVTNRSTGTKTKGQINLHRQRTTFLGATI